MNKRSLIVTRILTGAATLLALGFAALRTSMLLTAYDIENGFYTDAATHAVLRYSLIALAVIVFAAAHIYIKEGNRHIPLPEGKVLGGISVFVGCVLGGFLVYVFAKAVLPMFEAPGIADLAMAFFAVLAMLYYFTLGKNGDFRALLCSASALLLLALVFGLYFNPTVSYVNHSVILCYAASIFLMLTFIAEANFALHHSAYRRYISYAPTAVVLSFTLSVPDIALCITDGAAAITDIYYDILLLAFGIYHLARLSSIAVQTKEA